MYPIVIITNGFEIPTYLLINSLAFCLGITWIFIRASRLRMNVREALDVCLVSMIGGITGARLFHVVFEHPEIYRAHPEMIYKVWYGGFVFYGGLAGAVIFSFIYCRLKKISSLIYGDLFAPVLALGYTLGRLGCFAAGCCFGKPTTLPWAVHFPIGVEAPAYIGLHPTQLYSSIWSLLVLAILISYEKANRWPLPGQMFGWWLVLQSIGRIFIEQFRDDFRGRSVFNLSISTWLSAVALVIGLKLILRAKKQNAPTTI